MALPVLSINLGSMASQLEAIGSSFAADLARRISGNAMPGKVEPPESDEAALAAQAEKTGQLQKLESALANTVKYMADTHGEKAASAMIGIMYKRLGEDEITEESLGNAFLDVTRFIDKNFGTGAGDDFMAHLNGSLNDSLNEYFDNGLNESFMAAPAASGGAAGPAGNALDTAAMMEDMAKQYAEAIKQMLEDARTSSEEAGTPGAYADPARKEPLVGIMKNLMV